VSDSPPAGARASRCGVLALLCAAAWLTFALTGQCRFPHLEGWHGLSARDAALAAVLVAGVVTGLVALRRAAGFGRACATLALVLLAPFTVDAALGPLGSVPARARHTLFLLLTEVALATVLLFAWRAGRAGRAGRAAQAPVPAAPDASARRRHLPRPAVRTALALGSVAASLLLAEAAFRALDLRAYRNPVLIIPGAERRILLSEIALFRPTARPAGVDGLAARFRPYLYLKGWYDRPQWDYFDAQGCVDYVFDRWGLRDHDFELERQPGELRLVAIGDSFTFGVGAQLDDCWTEVLERTLEQQHDGPVEVINAGFASGHHPGMYAPWIAKDAVRLAPDVLIVGLCLNDMHPGVEMYAYELPEKPVVLGGRSVLASWLAMQAARWKNPGHGVLDFTDRVLAEPAPWEACQAALRASKAALDAAGIRMLVVPFPMLSGLRETPYPYERLLAMVRDFCTGAGIDCVDLRPEFLGQADEPLWAHPTDQHPNDRGHALIAAGIARHLAQR
jgi:hypothetical protein